MSHDLRLYMTSTTSPLTGKELFQNMAPPLSLEVNVEDPQSRDEKLNSAVNRLIPVALERRQGIRVIERAYGKYTVQVDAEVPCGTTVESRH